MSRYFTGLQPYVELKSICVFSFQLRDRLCAIPCHSIRVIIVNALL